MGSMRRAQGMGRSPQSVRNIRDKYKFYKVSYRSFRLLITFFFHFLYTMKTKMIASTTSAMI